MLFLDDPVNVVFGSSRRIWQTCCSLPSSNKCNSAIFQKSLKCWPHRFCLVWIGISRYDVRTVCRLFPLVENIRLRHFWICGWVTNIQSFDHRDPLHGAKFISFCLNLRLYTMLFTCPYVFKDCKLAVKLFILIFKNLLKILLPPPHDDQGQQTETSG